VVGSLVVSRASQEQVGQGGGSAVGPVHPMMHVAPLGRNVAGGEGASAVAQGDGAAERAGNGAVGAADGQRLAFGAEDSGNDLGMAGHAGGGGRGQVLAGVQHAGADQLGQLGIGHGQHQGGTLPALDGQVPGAQGSFGELDQGVGLPLGVAAQVGHAVGAGGA